MITIRPTIKCDMPRTIKTNCNFNIKTEIEHGGNSNVMDVELCTQNSTFWHQYIDKYLCIAILMMQGVNMMS